MSKKAWFVVYGLLFIVSIVLCIRLIHEPDLWWQLRTGEVILEKGQVPKTDVFSFAYQGMPWVNVKWGFEVIQASTVKFFGPEFLFLPQVLVNVLIILLLLLITKESRFKPSRFAKSIALILILIGMSYRMNGRPELISHLFTTIYIYIFYQIVNGKTKGALALIPLQLLWANLHEGFGVGIVMMAILAASFWLNYALLKIKTRQAIQTPIQITGISILAYLSVAIHPSGSTMLSYPYNIFTQLSENKFTHEILGFTSAEYWQVPSFINLVFLFLAGLYLWQTSKEKGKFNLGKLLKTVPLFYVLLFVAFFYLSLKAYRNVPFFLIISFPLVAAQFGLLAKKIKDKTAWFISVAIIILFYLSIVTNAFYNAFLPTETYGIAISPSKNNIGAAGFISQNNLAGPAFTDYLGSSFLLWKLQPDFKTFVDLRDLDVFEAEDMEIAMSACTNPDRQLQNGQNIWDVISNVYDFNYVCILNHPTFINLHRKLHKGNKFLLVYADELSSVYVKNNKKNQEVISKYRSGEVGIPFKPTPIINPSKAAATISSLFWPLHSYHNDSESAFLNKRAAYLNYIGEDSMK